MRWAPPKRQARHYLVATGVGWQLWVGTVLVTERLLVPATPVFLYAAVLGYQIEAGATGARGFVDRVFPGRQRSLGARIVSPLNQLRMAFLRDVAAASEWNANLVLWVLGLVTAVGLAAPLL